MKVLVVGLNYTPEPTGIAPYTAALCEGLAERGHAVNVLTAMPHYPEWRVRDGYAGWRSHEVVRGVKVTRVKHYVPTRPSGIRRLLSEISFGLRAATESWGRPDVVVFVSPALFSTAIGLARAKLLHRGLPSSVWVQDIYSLGIVETDGGSEGGFVAKVIGRVESAVLTAASGVVVIHDRFAEVAKELGADPQSIEVVRNWTHIRDGSDSDRSAVRADLGWDAHETVVLHSGAMGKKQHLGNVIAAAKLAAAQRLPIRFVLAGDGGERSSLESLAEGVSTIDFVDPLPEAEYGPALAAADVLLVNEHPGLREMAVPSKLTSYFSSGRPVVAATESTSLTALEVSSSGAGVRVDPDRPELLLDAVLGLRADPQRADDLGRLGQIYRDSVLSQDAAINHYAAWLSAVHRTSTNAGSRSTTATA